MPLRSVGGAFNNIGQGTPDPIVTFFNKLRRYPGNNKQWWVTKAQSDDTEGDNQHKQGDFLPEQLDKFYAGNNRAPRGHFVLNEFYKDRGAVAGILGIDRVIIKERPTTIAFYSGRAWYACNSTVYFSTVLTGREKAGVCYQEADPTSEDISELIATDGGMIPIPEAVRINKLLPDGDGVLVFAQNGVWSIYGTANGFTAQDITVSKVSHTGCSNPASIVACEAGIFWWSDIGIMGMSQKVGAYGPVLGIFESSNISETTVQEFYNNISEDAKRECKAIFDTKNNRISWLYRDDDVGVNQYNRVLHFDIALKAFYPWKFSTLDQSPYFVKGFYRGDRLTEVSENDAIVGNGIQIISQGDTVEVDATKYQQEPTTVEYLAMRGDEGRFCQTSSTEYVDWYSVNNVGTNYESFVQTGYNLFEDGMRNKRITYVMPYLRRTETGWATVGEEAVLENPSSCYMTVKWDWANSPVSNKWTTPVQVYRQSRFLAMPPGEYDTGFPMVITKNKVRGNGRAIQFKFGTDEPGVDFDLYGWALALTGNSIP